MNRKANPLIVVVALLVLGLAVFMLYSNATHPPDNHPGIADIPPKQPGDDRPVKPPPEAGTAPGTINR